MWCRQGIEDQLSSFIVVWFLGTEFCDNWVILNHVYWLYQSSLRHLEHNSIIFVLLGIETLGNSFKTQLRWFDHQSGMVLWDEITPGSPVSIETLRFNDALCRHTFSENFFPFESLFILWLLFYHALGTKASWANKLTSSLISKEGWQKMSEQGGTEVPVQPELNHKIKGVKIQVSLHNVPSQNILFFT